MTERLADVRARIAGIGQLGAIVNAMTGIAASRARIALEQIRAVDSYTETIADAMSQVISAAAPVPSPANEASRLALLVFVAEQGFVGAFSERILATIKDEASSATIFLIGTRGKAIAHAEGFSPVWEAAMPSHSPGIPKFADRVMQAIFAGASSGEFDRLDAVFADWDSGQAKVKRHQLFPVDLSTLKTRVTHEPLMHQPVRELLTSLSSDYLHAQICNVALHAFAAENESRMAAMSAASRQIESELDVYQGIERRVRQETITAEIIELATGERASKRHMRNT